MKDQRLVGADIYVARLANPIPCDKKTKSARATAIKKAQATKPGDGENGGDAQSAVPTLTGSLHEELTCVAKEPPPSKPTKETLRDYPPVAESRPCYRCVAYIHSAGIKRVFWTTNDGQWKGAKVRDLAEELQGAMTRMDPAIGLPVPDVFVTKHEILRMRRQTMKGCESSKAKEGIE